MSASDGLGINATSVVRNLLILHNLCDYAKACEISEQFDAACAESDWLELLDGTTFSKTFVPRHNSSGQLYNAVFGVAPKA